MLKLIPSEYIGGYIYRDGEIFDAVIYIDTDAIYGYSGIVYDLASVDMTNLGGGK